MNSVVEQIKERLPIADVVGGYLTLQKSGKYLKARSPFSNEKTPSFFVSPDKNLFHCFSTGKGGDIFSFVQEIEGVDFKGALKILAEKAGIELTPEPPEKRDERDNLLSIMEFSATWYENQLNLKNNSSILEYAKSRGLSDATIKNWRIGFAPDDWSQLSDSLLLEKRFSIKDLEKSGMSLISRDNKDRLFDRFRNRLMFPIFDQSGRVIAFSGRIMPNAKPDQAKYLNSPETPIFNKSKIVYGYHKAKNAVHSFGYWIVVEGQIDLLMSHQCGFTNTVATSGTSLTEEQLVLLKRLSDKIVIAYDSDKAGISASKRAFELALGMGFDIKIARAAGGKDPADILLENPDKWKEILRSTVHIIDFELDTCISSAKEPRQSFGLVSKQVIPYLKLLESDLERAYFARRIAEKLNISEQIVWDEIKRQGSQRFQSNESFPDLQGSKKPNSPEEALCGIIWLGGDSTILNQLTEKIGSDRANEICHSLQFKREELSMLAEIHYGSLEEKDRSKIISDLISRIELNEMRKKREELEGILKNKSDESILREYQELSQKINAHHLNN